MEKPLVLLVDDNEAICTLVTAVLRREFIVEFAGDGNEAIEKLRARQYVAVLLDLRMPVLDGYGVLDFLASTRPELLPKTLILTAALTRIDAERVRAYNICGVIAKPFEVESLLHEVRQCAGVSSTTAPPRAPLISGGMLVMLADLLRRM